MEVTRDIPLFLTSLNEYLNVVKLQVDRYHPHSQIQDGDNLLKGYIDVMKLLAHRGNEFDAKLKENDGNLREGEQQLNHTLNISEVSVCTLKDKISRLKDTENKLTELQDLTLKQGVCLDESARVLGETVEREKALEDTLRESESNLRMTEEKLREKENKLKELKEKRSLCSFRCL
eukprot:GHVR01043605.1.p1 GENE.GHVR01043605.1~~GHVR01043605.1.p1  ORF type:complete len:176 (+),score=31.57 GHVR01043605.1:84-611(+)